MSKIILCNVLRGCMRAVEKNMNVLIYSMKSNSRTWSFYFKLMQTYSLFAWKCDILLLPDIKFLQSFLSKTDFWLLILILTLNYI